MAKNKRVYSLTDTMKAALATDPVSYIEKWWESNATEEERRSAEERGASPSGAFAFVESVAKKYKQKSCACFPDQVVFDLAAIFLRTGSDGDEFVTQEELAKAEAREAKAAEEAKKQKERADKKEEERRSALTQEERDREDAVNAEREARIAESKAELERKQAAINEKKARAERAKEIARIMQESQMTFDF